MSAASDGSRGGGLMRRMVVLIFDCQTVHLRVPSQTNTATLVHREVNFTAANANIDAARRTVKVLAAEHRPGSNLLLAISG